MYNYIYVNTRDRSGRNFYRGRLGPYGIPRLGTTMGLGLGLHQARARLGLGQGASG